MKKFIAVLLMLMVTLALAVSMNAASNVSFEGGAEAFVFTPDGESWDDSDLFGNFKNVMPGETRTQTVLVKNNSGSYDYVKIYMKAEIAASIENTVTKVQDKAKTKEKMDGFLKLMTLTVKNGDNVIFEDTADKVSTLADYILLGQYAKGEGAELTVTLKVSPEMGDEYKDCAGEVDWLFSVEGYNNPTPTERPTPTPVAPTPTPKPILINPLTSDQFRVLLWVAVAVLAACATTLLLKKKKPKE